MCGGLSHLAPPFTYPTGFWLPLPSHEIKALKHQREYDKSGGPSNSYHHPIIPTLKMTNQYALRHSAWGQVLWLLGAFESKTFWKVKLDKLLNFNIIASHPNFNIIASHPISSSAKWR